MPFSTALEGQMREALMGWQHDVKQVTAAVTLKFYENKVEVTTPGSSNFNITLPPMDDAKGLVFTIKSLNAGGGTATVVAGADAPALGLSSEALKAAGDFITVTPMPANLPSYWAVLDSLITP
jgi:hypothetical protein